MKAASPMVKLGKTMWNETVKPAKDRPQFFKAFIDVVGMPGAVKLEQRDVLFLVPPAEQGPAK